MYDVNELIPYVWFLIAIVSSILTVVLSSASKNIIGKEWLVAYAVIMLVTWPGYHIISFIAQIFELDYQFYNWNNVLNIINMFGTVCFGLFLFSNWSNSRMKVGVKNLLFSFSGRIPRSAFWIAVCIFFPVGSLIGFIPYQTDVEGLPKIIMLIIFAVYLVLSIWIAFAVYAKRWHDCSKSGWMTLILLIPIIGFFWFMGYQGFVRGTKGQNQYGEDPLDIQSP